MESVLAWIFRCVRRTRRGRALVPEVNKEEGVRMAIVVFAGVALFYVMKLLLDAVGLE